MSVFSFIGGITSTIGKTVEKAVVLPIGNAIAHAISPNAVPQTVESFNATKTGRLLTTGIGASIVALPIAYAGVGTVAKAAVTNPVKTGVVIVGGSVLGSSEKAQNLVASQTANLPGNLNQFGSNIGKAVQDPSVATITQIAKDNPVLSSIAALGATYAGYKVVAPALAIESTRANTSAVQEAANYAKSQPQVVRIEQVAPTSPPSPPSGNALPSTGGTPVPKKKKRKKKVKKKTKKRSKKKKTRGKKRVKKKTKKRSKKKKKTIKRRKSKR